MTTSTPEPHIDKLKAGIWDIHEGVSAQQEKPEAEEESVMKGNLPKYKYINNLKQRYILQKEFEKILAKYKDDDFVGKVVTDEQFHADKAAKDLEFFGVDPSKVEPLPATNKMIEFFKETENRDPRLILSIHYVIEGSNNGAMFIAKAVKDSYGLEGTDGTYHLQPYGKEIRTKWGAFREAFNTLDISDELMKEMVQVGRQTFHHMNAVGKESHAQPEDS